MREQLARGNDRSRRATGVRARGAAARPHLGAVDDSGRAGRSIRAASKKPTSSPSPRTPDASASRRSSFAPIRTGAIAPISRAPTRRCPKPKCSTPFSRNSIGEHPSARCVLLSHPIEDRALLAEALDRAAWPQGRSARAAARREARTGRARAAATRGRRSARKLAEDASQQRLLAALGAGLRSRLGAAARRGLRQFPHRRRAGDRRDDRRRAPPDS